MPYTSMPAWPRLLRRGSVESRLLHHDLLARLLQPRECPPARSAPERAESHEGVNRAREEALRGHRLRQVPRHARPGRRTFGANAEGRLGLSHTRGGPRAELDLPGRVVPRGHLPDDEHGVERHAHAVVPRRPHARATMGDHRLHRLSLGQQRTWLYQPRHRQARPGADRSGQGGRELRLRSCGPLSDRRADHGAGTRVPSARDQRHRSGDLRCGLHRPPRSMARHERAEDGEERAVASRAAGGGGGARLALPPARVRAAARREASLARRKSRRLRPARRRTPLPRRNRRQATSHPSSPTRSRSRFLRRCRRAPASPTSSSATPRTRWISGSSIWPAPIPFSSPAREARTIAPKRRGRSHRCRELRPGRMVGHLQAAPSPSLGRPVLARRVHAGRLLGLGRVLARAWQQARSHALVLPLRRARNGPIGRRPDGEDGADHSRHRAGPDRLGAAASRLSRHGTLGGEPRQPAATSA